MISTHWMPAAFKTDEWPDNPAESPAAAAQLLLDQHHDHDDAWEAWDELQRGGSTTITLAGFISTTELIADEDARFDGYEPGSEWFKATGETMRMRVALAITMDAQ